MNLYPTPEHQGAAEAIVEFFATTPEIDAVCLICSCARGKQAETVVWIFLSMDVNVPKPKDLGLLRDR